MKILKDYIQEIISEELYWSNLPSAEDFKDLGIASALKKSLFRSNESGDISSAWIADQEETHDVNLSDNFKREISDYVKKSYAKALDLSRQDPRRAEILLLRSLDKRYGRYFKDL